MQISVERLKQIIKEELEAHTLSEQSVMDQPIGLGKRKQVEECVRKPPVQILRGDAVHLLV